MEGKKKCDRCQRENGPVTECSFEFKHPRAYWKEIYEGKLGKRMTLKRRQALDATQFDYRHPPNYWLDLCEPCWEECSEPRDLFPMDFHEEVLKYREPAARNLLAYAKVRA